MKQTLLLHVSFFERTSLDNGFIDRIFYILVGEIQQTPVTIVQEKLKL